jgi:hypothetical protein
LFEVLGQPGRDGHHTPNKYAGGKNPLSSHAIREPSQRNANQCVEKSECGSERAQRAITQAPFFSYGFAHGTEYLPVKEVHGVDSEQNPESEPNSCRLFLHKKVTSRRIILLASGTKSSDFIDRIVTLSFVAER